MGARTKLHVQMVRARYSCRNAFLRLNELLDITNLTGSELTFKRTGKRDVGRAPEIKLLKPVKPEPMKFDTGNAPLIGTLERDLLNWECVEIFENGDNPEKTMGKIITKKRADREIEKILRNPKASHEYLAHEGAMLSKDPGARRYLLHLMFGACGEDFVFMPGEGMDRIYKKEATRSWQDVHDVLFSEVPSFFGGVFRIGAKVWRTMMRKPDDDPINRPYFAHFYDPSRKEGDRGLNLLNGDLKFQSALERAQKLWMKASEYYRQGNRPRAYYTLGHLLHLICDMHVPAHVHNDIHGPTMILGGLDSFEGWVKKSDYQSERRDRRKANITIWKSEQLDTPITQETWTPENVYEKIGGFVHEIAATTYGFRSVDAKGTMLGQDRTGELSDGECYEQASVLIPSAMTKCAEMILSFIEYHRVS